MGKLRYEGPALISGLKLLICEGACYVRTNLAPSGFLCPLCEI
jgi:hypothetical protein